MIKYSILLIIIISALSFIVAVLLYGYNREKYYELLYSFQKEYTLPSPYSFYCTVGFFGAFPVIYFFLGLKNKRKIFFLSEKSELYDFFDDKKDHLTGWMKFFFFFWVTGISCVLLLFLIAELIK